MDINWDTVIPAILESPKVLDFEYKGYQGLILRGPMFGALCGYVGLPEGHDYYGMYFEEIPIDAYGGLNFSEPGDGILRPEGYYWIGFDCGHAMDIAPCFGDPIYNFPGATYKDIDFVKDQIKRMIDLLKARDLIDGI